MPSSKFFDENNNYKRELFSKDALEQASKFQNLTPTQIRRFFNDVKALESKVKAKKDFNAILPLIKMLKAKVSYATSRKGQQKVPLTFKNFIYEMVDNINDARDFEAFCLYFEAVLGYFSGIKSEIKGGKK